MARFLSYHISVPCLPIWRASNCLTGAKLAADRRKCKRRAMPQDIFCRRTWFALLILQIKRRQKGRCAAPVAPSAQYYAMRRRPGARGNRQYHNIAEPWRESGQQFRQGIGALNESDISARLRQRAGAADPNIKRLRCRQMRPRL